MWLTFDAGPANAELRAGVRDVSVLRASQMQLVDFNAAPVRSDVGGDRGTQLASLHTGDESDFAFRWPDNQPEPASARLSFEERFSFDQPSAPDRPLQASASFNERFLGEVSNPGVPVRSAAIMPAAPAPVVVAVLPRPAVRSGGVQGSPKRASRPGFRLASLDPSPDIELSDPTRKSSPLKDLKPDDSDPLARLDTSRTAIYDITSHTVYLPDGRRLEAHSGLGRHMDDPRYITARGTGPTPPNVYSLKLRESLFHGVRAIRLIPADTSKMHGRDGMLAHSYMLGPSGQSNGCVSFSDYATFLDAFLQGNVNRLVVVERLAKAPSPKTASDWLSNTLRDIFQRS